MKQTLHGEGRGGRRGGGGGDGNKRRLLNSAALVLKEMLVAFGVLISVQATFVDPFGSCLKTVVSRMSLAAHKLKTRHGITNRTSQKLPEKAKSK